MLQDRHPTDKVFEQIVELVPKMDPILAKIDRYLTDEAISKLVRTDLSKRYPKTLLTGRNSTPVEVVLRMLVVKRLYHYSYAETERYVSDSLVLRQFCRVSLNPVPDDTTLIKWANLIQAETLQQFNDRITQLALEHKITKGQKLRTDGTVVETNIHLPWASPEKVDTSKRQAILRNGGRIMTKKGARTYTVEFKQETVRLVKSTGKSCSQIERELGITPFLLSKWVKQFGEQGEQAFPGKGHQTGIEEELHQLRRENEILRQERDILKKVVAIFSVPTR
jgi:transposase-like protein